MENNLAIIGTKENLADIMKDYYDVTINVPMVLEAKIGNNWLDTKDVM